jgi:hypothetical protein
MLISRAAAPAPPPGVGALSLLAILQLYLTDFLKCTFLRENAQNRTSYGGEKSRMSAVYRPAINQGAEPCK